MPRNPTEGHIMTKFRLASPTIHHTIDHRDMIHNAYSEQFDVRVSSER